MKEELHLFISDCFEDPDTAIPPYKDLWLFVPAIQMIISNPDIRKLCTEIRHRKIAERHISAYIDNLHNQIFRELPAQAFFMEDEPHLNNFQGRIYNILSLDEYKIHIQEILYTGWLGFDENNCLISHAIPKDLAVTMYYRILAYTDRKDFDKAYASVAHFLKDNYIDTLNLDYHYEEFINSLNLDDKRIRFNQLYEAFIAEWKWHRNNKRNEWIQNFIETEREKLCQQLIEALKACTGCTSQAFT
jgi:hypothetical protein